MELTWATAVPAVHDMNSVAAVSILSFIFLSLIEARLYLQDARPLLLTCQCLAVDFACPGFGQGIRIIDKTRIFVGLQHGFHISPEFVTLILSGLDTVP